MFENYQRPLYVLDEATTYRVSSWDRNGNNIDFLILLPGESHTLAELKGPGCIKHFYCAMVNHSRLLYRKLILRVWWDDEKSPSVEVPLGDFFCISNCSVRFVNSLMMVINPGSSNMYTHGLNCYLPMPFAKSARVELEYQASGEGDEPATAFWYHLDSEHCPDMSWDNVGYLHAQWRREKLTKSTDSQYKNVQLWPGTNLNGSENYVILEAKGKGQIVGLHLQVDNIAGGWYGEGNDQIFIDGEKWPPSYPGTGTEEIFGGGACPNTEYSGPYTGFHLISSPAFSGKNAMYRWYINDLIKFQRSIKMTIEHGHANNFENDYASVAYWYQIEPHAVFPELLPVRERLPRFPEAFFEAERKVAQINELQSKLMNEKGPLNAMQIVFALRLVADKLMREDKYEDACIEYDKVITGLTAWL
ncbi:MAG: DUF2961 domain-containing protein [Chloroflexi bacterium]|nr:DUF2961 domain-containing protein [Chloroflexota bacterium]